MLAFAALAYGKEFIIDMANGKLHKLTTNFEATIALHTGNGMNIYARSGRSNL